MLIIKKEQPYERHNNFVLRKNTSHERLDFTQWRFMCCFTIQSLSEWLKKPTL